MAKAMEQMIATTRTTTPVDQPSGLLFDTVTWDTPIWQESQHFGLTVIGIMPSAWAKGLLLG